MRLKSSLPSAQPSSALKRLILMKEHNKPTTAPEDTHHLSTLVSVQRQIIGMLQAGDPVEPKLPPISPEQLDFTSFTNNSTPFHDLTDFQLQMIYVYLTDLMRYRSRLIDNEVSLEDLYKQLDNLTIQKETQEGNI